MQDLSYLDLAPREVKVALPGWMFDSDKERVRNFVVREVSADGARAWKNARTNAMVLNDAGKMVGLRDVADLEILLLTYCVFEVLNEGRGKVSRSTLERLPAEVAQGMYDAAMELSKSALKGKAERSDLIDAATELIFDIAGINPSADAKLAAAKLIEDASNELQRFKEGVTPKK